jgi:hypothetical protein
MKKIIIVAAAAILLGIGLASCGSSNTNNDATSVSTPAPIDTYVPPTPKEQFLSDINSLNDPIIAQTADSDLWSLATSTCDALNQGNSVTDLITYLANSGAMTNNNATSIGEIIGAAVKDVCPSHMQEVQDYINANAS